MTKRLGRLIGAVIACVVAASAANAYTPDVAAFLNSFQAIK